MSTILTQPVRPRELRPGRRTGRGVRPLARPAQRLAPPRLERPVEARTSGCRVERPTVVTVPPIEDSHWRLTERGIALVLATGLALAAAALTVVALTALRVTGDGFASSQLSIGAGRG